MPSSLITNLLIDTVYQFLPHINSNHDYHPEDLELHVDETDECTLLSYQFGPEYNGDEPYMLDGPEKRLFGVSKEAIWVLLSGFGRIKTTLESGFGPFKRSQTSGQLEFARERIRRGKPARGRSVLLSHERLVEFGDFLCNTQQQLAVPAAPDYCALNSIYYGAIHISSCLNGIVERGIERRIYHRLVIGSIGSRIHALMDMDGWYQYADGVDFNSATLELRPYQFLGVRVILPEDTAAPLPVKLVFADRRRPEIHYDREFCDKLTQDYCLMYGYEQLLLNPLSREWIAANGKCNPGHLQTRAFIAASMPHIPTFPLGHDMNGRAYVPPKFEAGISLYDSDRDLPF